MPRHFIIAIALTTVCCVSKHALAETAIADAQATAAMASPTGLQPLDWLILAIYGVSTIGLGFYFGRQQTSANEYFVGSGNMNPILVGVSLFATLLSTISYLSMPGEALGKGPVALLGMLAFPLIFVVVTFGLLPVYMRTRVTSAYELLEVRLGLSIRLLGATMFLVLRLVWMTLLVYLAAKAMTVMMDLDEKWIPAIVLVTGLVTVIYTSVGGLRAVVVTDLMQTILLFGGAVLVLVTITYNFGGFGWFPTQWQSNWDTQPFFSFDPSTRLTVVGTILSVVCWYTATLGGDQTSVQRFMATRDARAARQAVATQLCVATVVQLTLYLVGFALLGYFLMHQEHLPPGMTLKNDADKLFPRFIAYHLPVGVSGLVVAGMFAAAMSSIDSGVNSITAVVMTDFGDRLGFRPKTEKGRVRSAQVLALTIGVIVVLGSTFMKYIEGNITEVTNKTVNLLTTPIFALFFFALFVKSARPFGVWIAAICGTVTAAAIAFSGPLVVLLATRFNGDPEMFGIELMTSSETGFLVTAVRELNPASGEWELSPRDPISFQWIAPVALLVNIAIGTTISFIFPRREFVAIAKRPGDKPADQ